MIIHKYQALGNDFLIFDCINYPQNLDFKTNHPDDFARFVIQKSDRRRIGCDQFIVMEKSTSADCKITFYNADGSRAEACGNGTVASGVYASKLLGKNEITIETDAQVMNVKVAGNQATIEFEMPKDLGLSEDSHTTIDMYVGGSIRNVYLGFPPRMTNNNFSVRVIKIQNISVGNPHCVVILEGFPVNTLYDVEMFSEMGKTIENLTSIFPNRTNVEFVVQTGENKFDVFVWERGAGRTFACGTGACAVAFACVKNGFADATKPIAITMAGSFLYANSVPMKVAIKESTLEFTNSAFFEGEISC